MPRADALKAREARRAAGDPSTENDFLYSKTRATHVDEWGYRYKLNTDHIRPNTTVDAVFLIPTDNQRLALCDGCHKVHNPRNANCGGNGGHSVIKRSLRFSDPSPKSKITLFPILRNAVRPVVTIYKATLENYSTPGKRRVGRATLSIHSIGSRTYKRASFLK